MGLATLRVHSFCPRCPGTRTGSSSRCVSPATHRPTSATTASQTQSHLPFSRWDIPPNSMLFVAELNRFCRAQWCGSAWVVMRIRMQIKSCLKFKKLTGKYKFCFVVFKVFSWIDETNLKEKIKNIFKFKFLAHVRRFFISWIRILHAGPGLLLCGSGSTSLEKPLWNIRYR